MKALTITQAKPNPAGKDQYRYDIPASQLGGEWVDFKNTGNESYPLDNIILQHVAYTREHPIYGEWEEVSGFTGNLSVGEVVRVHSGAGPVSQLLQIDLQGANYHIFSGKGYVWNNNKADRPRLYDKVNRRVIDEALYDAYPPEGKILKRSGPNLV